jgi:hypothetical protein
MFDYWLLRKSWRDRRECERESKVRDDFSYTSIRLSDMVQMVQQDKTACSPCASLSHKMPFNPALCDMVSQMLRFQADSDQHYL